PATMAGTRRDCNRPIAARRKRHRAEPTGVRPHPNTGENAVGLGAYRRPHRADAVELSLFAGVLDGALARLVALVEQLDLLELLERLGECHPGILELALELVGRALEVVAPPDRRLGIGRIGEMRRIVDAGALLLGRDLAIEIGRHAIEVGD